MHNTAQTSNDRTNRRKLVWGIVCLVGPTALIFLALMFYAVANFVFSASDAPAMSECQDVDGIVQGANCFPAEEPNVGRTILNVALFLAGAVSVATWLPGIIIGIILLATRKSVPHANNQP